MLSVQRSAVLDFITAMKFATPNTTVNSTLQPIKYGGTRATNPYGANVSAVSCGDTNLHTSICTLSRFVPQKTGM